MNFITPFLLSQILALIGFIFDLVSWQLRSRTSVLICFILNGLAYSLHFVLLGAWTGAALAALSTIRYSAALTFAGSRVVMTVFLAITTLVTWLTYASPITLVGGAGSILGTIGSFQREDRHLRLWLMAATSCWVLHNIVVWTPVGIVGEVGFLASNVVAFIRFRGRERPAVIPSAS